MTATYFILQPDGTQVGPVPQAQVIAYLRSGHLRKENLVRRADLAEFFAVEAYPEFAQALLGPRPSGVVRPGVAPRSSIVRPGVARKAAPEPREGPNVLVWGMLIILLTLVVWGAKAGWDKWRESGEEKRQAAAEKWKSENLPEYEADDLGAKITEFGSVTERRIMIYGRVVEKGEPKIHPEYGRAERHEVYVRLAFVRKVTGEIPTIHFDLETVIIHHGKGDITVEKDLPIEQVAELALLLEQDQVKVTGQVRYEK